VLQEAVSDWISFRMRTEAGVLRDAFEASCSKIDPVLHGSGSSVT
jgi:hypothetical protein